VTGGGSGTRETSAEGYWTEGPTHPVLGPNDVHVWSIPLDPPRDELSSLVQVLSEEERERADRFVAAADRVRFVVGHARLRGVLARYLDIVPSAIRFETSPFGKPSLLMDGSGGEIQFNFSHSDQLALCAIARARRIGVDVERIEPSSSLAEIAGRYFSPREAAALAALPPEEQCAAFYACWSRKEAYVKARGRGLSIALDSFDVSLAPGDQDALLADRGEQGGLAWRIFDLSPSAGFAAALAVEGRCAAISRYRWSEAGSIPGAR
jgi:4'-phosphopantetheinyl transferase